MVCCLSYSSCSHYVYFLRCLVLILSSEHCSTTGIFSPLPPHSLLFFWPSLLCLSTIIERNLKEHALHCEVHNYYDLSARTHVNVSFSPTGSRLGTLYNTCDTHLHAFMRQVRWRGSPYYSRAYLLFVFFFSLPSKKNAFHKNKSWFGESNYQYTPNFISPCYYGVTRA